MDSYFSFFCSNQFLSESSSPKKKRAETVEDRNMRSTKARVVNWWNSQHFDHWKTFHIWGRFFPPHYFESVCNRVKDIQSQVHHCW